MKLGWAYLGLAVVFVLAGTYLALQDRVVGDLLLVGSLVLIYLGATTLADEDAAASLLDSAAGDSTEDAGGEADEAVDGETQR